MRVRLVKEIRFEAAHFLPTFPEGHKCHRMHGHSFRVEVIVEGDAPIDRGYLMDYGDIRERVAPVREALDHRVLNDIDGLDNPTSEMIARWVWDRLKPGLPLLTEVIVHETCTTRCHYLGPATDA